MPTSKPGLSAGTRDAFRQATRPPTATRQDAACLPHPLIKHERAPPLIALARDGLAHGDLSAYNLLVHDGRPEEVIDAFFDLADAIITVRNLNRQAWGHTPVG